MGDFRTEKDSLGEVKVPRKALFGAQTQRAVENFTISTTPLPWVFIEALLQVKYAGAKANEKLGLLSKEKSKSICEAVDKLLLEKPRDQFPVSVFQTGSGTSSNMNANEVITSLAKVAGVRLSPNDHVNLGQSSNDVIPTAIHITSKKLLAERLLPGLTTLSATIRKFADDHKTLIKTGRTHLMDALPIMLKDELEAWALQIDECRDRFTDSDNRLRQVPLGGTAIGSGVNCHPEFAELALKVITERTGLHFSKARSSFKGQASLDIFIELSGNLKTCAVALSKIANDLRWMNSGPLTGLSEISLPVLQPGSSIMPAKVNPVIPEAVLMATAQVIGNDTALTLAGLGGSFQLNTMLPLVAAKLSESLELLSGCAHSLAIKAISNMKVNSAVFEEGLQQNPILITSLNPIIGYSKAAEIGKIAQREQRPILEVALELSGISLKELKKLLDPANLARGNRKAD